MLQVLGLYTGVYSRWYQFHPSVTPANSNSVISNSALFLRISSLGFAELAIFGNNFPFLEGS